MASERTQTVKANIVWSVIIKGISIVTSLLLVPLTIGYISSELYGVWLTLASIIGWLGFMDIGFTQGLKNKLTESIALGEWERGKSLVSTTYVMMIVLFVPICFLVEFLIPHIDWCNLLNVNPRYQTEIVQTLRILLVFGCLQMIVNVLVSVVAAFQRVALSSSFVVIGNILSLGIIYLLTKTVAPSLVYLCFSISATPIFVIIIASFYLFNNQIRSVAPSLNSVDFRLAKEIFGLGYKFFIINIQAVILYQTTNILISNLSSPVMVTSYNIAYKYLNIAMLIFNIFAGPLWPAYTDAYTKKDFLWMRKMRNKMNILLLLSALGCVIMALVAPWAYNIWIGNKAVVQFEMTWLVAIYVIVYCWMTLNGTLIVGMGKIELESWVVIVGMILHIPLSLFLARYISSYGVIVSMTIINITYGMIFQVQTNKLLNQSAYGIWAK